MENQSKCPFTGGSAGTPNRDWWPNQVNLGILHQHSSLSDPLGEDFNYGTSRRTSGSPRTSASRLF